MVKANDLVYYGYPDGLQVGSSLPPFKDGLWHVMSAKRLVNGDYCPVGTLIVGHRLDDSPIEAVADNLREAERLAGEQFQAHAGQVPLLVYQPDGTPVRRWGAERKPPSKKPHFTVEQFSQILDRYYEDLGAAAPDPKLKDDASKWCDLPAGSVTWGDLNRAMDKIEKTGRK